MTWEVRDYFTLPEIYLSGLVTSCSTITHEELAGTHTIPEFSLN